MVFEVRGKIFRLVFLERAFVDANVILRRITIMYDDATKDALA